MEELQHNHIENREGEKRFNFNRDNATLLLDVVPESVSFESLREIAVKEGLSQKTEFHITLIGRETGEIIVEKLSGLPPEERDILLLRIEDLAKSFTWSHTFSSEYYLISKEYEGKDGEGVETRKSIIQTLLLPDLEAFYSQLNHLLGTAFNIPFPHITLFTTSTNEETKLRGIGIYSEEQLKTLNPVKIELDRDASHKM